MASTIKQRLRRYNGADYDYIYLSANMGDVVGTLGVSNGGTGATSGANAIYSITNSATALSSTDLATGDYLPILDTSASTGKKVTLENLAAYLSSHSGGSISMQNSDTAPTSLSAGSILIGLTRIWVGMYGGTIYEIKVSPPFTNPLNTDQLSLGMNTVYFTAYPDLKWCVDHLDGDYAYLGLYNCTEQTNFGTNTTYSGSTIAAKCTTFLNNTIPNVADYLENVTVHGVTNKVFIPSYKMFSGTASYDGGDANDPTFSWPSASDNNRKACVSNWSTINNYFWLSSPYDSSSVWRVRYSGNFDGYIPSSSGGFRPEVKVRYKAG